jgi:hypothetical protein
MRHDKSAGIALLLALLAPHAAHAFNQPACDIACPGSFSVNPNGVNNNNLLTHAEVVPIFLGSYWQTHGSSLGQMLGYMHLLTNGPYLDSLRQYEGGSGFGPVRIAPVAPISTAIGGSFTTDDATTIVNQMIGAGTVPPPIDQATNMVYVAIAPPYVQDTTLTMIDPSAKGWNGPKQCDSNCGRYNSYHYTLIVVSPGDNNFYLSGYSYVFSHELEEAISENITVSGCNANYDQITDVCACYGYVGALKPPTHVLNGSAIVAPYWSKQDGACVVPEGWSLFEEYNGQGSGNGWWSYQMPSTNVVQVVAGDGGYCLDPTCSNIALLTSNGHVMLYNGDGTFKNVTGANLTFSMLAAGEGGILGLTSDMAKIYRFDGGFSNGNPVWTELPLLPPFHQFTSMASGVMDLAIDESGSPWLLSNGAWGNRGTPGDQFLVGEGWAAKLALNHSDVSIWQGPGYSWVSTGHAGAEIYVGGNQSIALRDLSPSGEIFGMQSAELFGNYLPGAWQDMTSASSDIALFDSQTISMVRLLPDQSYIFADSFSIESGLPSWFYFGNGARRLIGGGKNLVVVQGDYF